MKEKLSKLHEGHFATILPVMTVVFLAWLVSANNEIVLAPTETFGQTLLRLAIFTAYWPLCLHFFGGRDYKINDTAKKTEYGMILMAVAIIIGSALVIKK